MSLNTEKKKLNKDPFHKFITVHEPASRFSELSGLVQWLNALFEISMEEINEKPR